jgi:hypothetical protein
MCSPPRYTRSSGLVGGYLGHPVRRPLHRRRRAIAADNLVTEVTMAATLSFVTVLGLCWRWGTIRVEFATRVGRQFCNLYDNPNFRERWLFPSVPVAIRNDWVLEGLNGASND